MSSVSSEKIEKIVRDVVAELGLRVAERGLIGGSATPEKGTRALFVLHSGFGKLDEAMNQVRLIEEMVTKSGVFTGESARSFICGDDVREKTGSRCLLDTVNPKGLEKVLAIADVLVLPTFCLGVAAKVTHLIGDNQESDIVLSALLQGKKVLASRDSFMVNETLTNEKLKDEIVGIVKKLEGFGVVFCPTDQLSEVFKQMISPIESSGKEIAKDMSAEKKLSALNLITAEHVHVAVNENRVSIELASGGKVTPLARDLAKEYFVKILEI